jgi:alpha-galactosidase
VAQRGPARAVVAGILLCLIAGALLAAVAWPEDQLGERPIVWNRAEPRTLAPTPPMGWNSWNAFGCDVDERKIRDNADALVNSGLRDAGYLYVNLDDCWSAKHRKHDRLVAKPGTFPSGIAALANFIHGRGLRLGIYADAGFRTCMGYPGSLGHEKVDARTFAAWGVDYVKYDNCHHPERLNTRRGHLRRYRTMSNALAGTGRPIVLSICEWGVSAPWLWGAGLGDLWRTTPDIKDSWPSVRRIIAVNTRLARYAQPGAWNDPDMLEVGNGGLTAVEQRTHFSMWAMMGAPLLAGTDLQGASLETLRVLGNRAVIAVNQDAFQPQAGSVSPGVFAKRMSDGSVAVALYNAADSPRTMTASGLDLGFAGSFRSLDLWTGQEGNHQTRATDLVPAHGVTLLRLTSAP